MEYAIVLLPLLGSIISGFFGKKNISGRKRIVRAKLQRLENSNHKEKCLSANDLSKCLFRLLSDANTYDDPSIAEETERIPHDATLFVKGPCYGTRSSTVVLFSSRGKVRFLERSFTAKGKLREECSYSFTLPEHSKSAP